MMAYGSLWRRFRARRAAYRSFLLMTVAVSVAVVALPFSSRWHNVQNLDRNLRTPPQIRGSLPYAVYAERMQGVGGGASSVIGPMIHRGEGWLGYDDLGRSGTFRLLFGWLISLGVGMGAALTSVVLGVSWGMVAGGLGGRIDSLMMRFVDLMYGLPYVLFVIVLKVVLEPPLTHLMGGESAVAGMVVLFVAIGSVSWLTMARVVRGQVLSLKGQPFVEAARGCGASEVRILWRHVLPNLAGAVIVYATLVVPQAIMQEAFLSFLGIGILSPTPSLGRLAADGVQAVNLFVGYWWLIVFPCGALALTLLALNVIGDGLRDAIDPRSTMSSWV